MVDLPKRKRIRLKEYDYSQNGMYFITICVKDRRNLLGNFVGDDDHIVPSLQLSKYGIIAEKYISGIKGIDKYVIMPNHVHLIIFIDKADDNGTMWSELAPTTSIPNIIKSFKTLFTKEIGLSFWQRSYHDHIIRNEAEYQKIWEYIDANPLTWEKDCFYTEDHNLTL